MTNEENECNGLIVAINQRLVMESVQDFSAESGCFARELRISKSTGCKKLSVHKHVCAEHWFTENGSVVIFSANLCPVAISVFPCLTLSS